MTDKIGLKYIQADAAILKELIDHREMFQHDYKKGQKEMAEYVKSCDLLIDYFSGVTNT
jgi:hypothetical protein